ncbi:kinetochore protein Nuf2 homolog [Ptychodera flava]|uniref:kinetochore protein Nuf2 homolog n=1 Tax=Ptychodera flava TaxID=63121 RepID=UPI00396A49FC
MSPPTYAEVMRMDLEHGRPACMIGSPPPYCDVTDGFVSSSGGPKFNTINRSHFRSGLSYSNSPEKQQLKLKKQKLEYKLHVTKKRLIASESSLTQSSRVIGVRSKHLLRDRDMALEAVETEKQKAVEVKEKAQEEIMKSKERAKRQMLNMKRKTENQLRDMQHTMVEMRKKLQQQTEESEIVFTEYRNKISGMKDKVDVAVKSAVKELTEERNQWKAATETLLDLADNREEQTRKMTKKVQRYGALLKEIVLNLKLMKKEQHITNLKMRIAEAMDDIENCRDAAAVFYDGIIAELSEQMKKMENRETELQKRLMELTSLETRERFPVRD